MLGPWPLPSARCPYGNCIHSPAPKLPHVLRMHNIPMAPYPDVHWNKTKNVHYTSMAGPLTTQIPKRCKIDSCLFMTFIWRCRPALTYISFSSTDDVHSAMQSKFSRHMYLQFLAPGHFWACYCVGAPVSKTWLEGHTVTQTHIHVFLHVQMTHTLRLHKETPHLILIWHQFPKWPNTKCFKLD